MTTASDLVRQLAEQEELDAHGVLQALNGFFDRNDLAAEAMEALNEWMDDEQLQDELAAWMVERGLTVPGVSTGEEDEEPTVSETDDDDLE